jgi:2-polyprenyl-6-methoxyphenol hydroxylase-like FAD-dependent oxidoreductase
MGSNLPETQKELADGGLGVKENLSTETADIEVHTPVLIVGGGPVGMLLAYTLSEYHGQPCILVEQSPTTTTYPKMELTQGRAMEIYRFLGLADELRSLGVPESENLDEIITTGLGESGHTITVWKRDSPAEIRRKSKELNDGTLPREPYLRCHQIVIEKWLKEKISKQEKINSFWGWQFVGLKEGENEVISEAVNADGRKLRIRSDYIIGCDGAGSAVRRCVGLDGPRTDL